MTKTQSAVVTAFPRRVDATPSQDLKPALVANRIREMILESQLLPGEPVRERALSEILQVSRTPLREALKILASEGLVKLHPRRGATVAVLGANDVRHLLEFLGGLEAFAGKLACRNATPEELRELRALHHEMLASYLRGDRIGYFDRNQQIHQALVRCAMNPVLAEHHRVVNAQLYRIRYECNLKTNRWEAAIKEHEAILDALEARDEAAIERLLETHVLKAFDLMQAAGDFAKAK